MVSEVDSLRDDLANARYDSMQLRIKLDSVEKRLKDVEEVNVRLADRNWELQKRIFDQMTYMKNV